MTHVIESNHCQQHSEHNVCASLNVCFVYSESGKGDGAEGERNDEVVQRVCVTHTQFEFLRKILKKLKGLTVKTFATHDDARHKPLLASVPCWVASNACLYFPVQIPKHSRLRGRPNIQKNGRQSLTLQSTIQKEVRPCSCRRNPCRCREEPCSS